MAPAHDTGVFTTVRRLLNIFTAYMGCCEEFDPKCSGDELLMVTGFVNDASAENNEKNTFAAESRKAKVEATEKQLRCGMSYYESVMLPNLETIPFIERGMENNGDKTFAAESRKAEVEAVEATEKQVGKKAVMADDAKKAVGEINTELGCEEKFLNFAVLPFAAAENNGDKTFAAESRKAKMEAVEATEKQVGKKCCHGR